MPTSARPADQKVFDYTSLDAETSQFVQQQTGEIRVLMKRTAQGIVEIGHKLIEVKKKLGHEQPGFWWDLGGKHLLYCGDPNSSEFVGRVTGNTQKVSLLIAFPPTPDWQPAIRAKARLIVDEYLPQGKNLDQLDEILEANILFYSCLQNIVVACFLASPEILSAVNRHGRRGLFAEPDERRCKGAIANWKKAGLKVERLG